MKVKIHLMSMKIEITPFQLKITYTNQKHYQHKKLLLKMKQKIQSNHTEKSIKYKRNCNNWSKVLISNCDLCSCTLQNEDLNGYIAIHHMIKNSEHYNFQLCKIPIKSI